MNEWFGRGRDYNVNEYPTFTDWIFTLIQFAAVTLNRLDFHTNQYGKKKKQKTENTLCILLQIIHQAEFLSFVSAPRQ